MSNSKVVFLTAEQIQDRFELSREETLDVIENVRQVGTYYHKEKVEDFGVTQKSIPLYPTKMVKEYLDRDND